VGEPVGEYATREREREREIGCERCAVWLCWRQCCLPRTTRRFRVSNAHRGTSTNGDEREGRGRLARDPGGRARGRGRRGERHEKARATPKERERERERVREGGGIPRVERERRGDQTRGSPQGRGYALLRLRASWKEGGLENRLATTSY